MVGASEVILCCGFTAERVSIEAMWVGEHYTIHWGNSCDHKEESLEITGGR